MASRALAGLTVAGLLSTALGERGALELRALHESNQSQEWFWSPSPPCNPADEDWKTYGGMVKIDLAEGYNFWDACQKLSNGKCPDGCVPYSQGWRAAAGRMFSGACKKSCRYTDDYMLKSHHQGFLATSLAVLERQVARQVRNCGGLASLLYPTCKRRQRKISALISFAMKAAAKAGEAAADGNVARCQERLPPALGEQLAKVLGLLLGSLQHDGEQMDEGEQIAEAVQKIKRVATRFKDPRYCFKAAEIGAKQKDPNAMEMMEAGLNESVKQHMGSNAVDTKRVIAEVKEKGARKTVEDQLDRDTADLDQAEAQVEAEVAASALQVSSWGGGALNLSSNWSAFEASLTELMAQESGTSGGWSTQVRKGHRGAVGAAALVASRGGAVAGIEGGRFIMGALKKLWWTLVALLYHSILGSIYGVLATATCLLSMGGDTNKAGITNMHGWWQLTWLVTCPLACISYGWGINPYHMDDSFWQTAWNSEE